MNGTLTNLFLYIINVLLGVVMILFGYVLRQHKDMDEQHRQRLDREIDTLRERGHDMSAKLAALDALIRR